MAEAVAMDVAGKVVDSLFEVAKKEISYMCNCTENVMKLRGEAKNLENMKGGFEQRMNIAKDKAEDLLVGVEDWIHEANDLIAMTDEFSKDFEVNRTCFNLPLCVNLGALHRYGKKAISIADSIQKHQTNGKRFETSISVPARSPRLLDVYQKANLDDILTQKSVLGKIVQAMEDDKIQIVGIHGTGGVGKTTLAKEALAVVKSRFDDYVFTTITQLVNVEKVRNEVEAAAKRVLRGEKILVILDDMWKGLNLEDLGIPDDKNCKILLTTRSIDVCAAMNTQTSIRLNVLQEDEAWILFKRVIGEQVETNNNLKQIASKVCSECGGLPLIIRAVRKALKNKKIGLWNDALVQLQDHAPTNISPEISEAYTRLRLSYNYLESEEAKWCFLQCSMFPEDYEIPLESLAYYGVGLEPFNNLKSIEDARRRVRIAIETLESSYLLLDADDRRFTRMHDVVRDVALLMASEGKNNFLVEAGKGLTKWLPRKSCALDLRIHTKESLVL